MVIETQNRACELLLVEDNPADARLTRDALREAHPQLRVHLVQDGAAALRFLRREPPYSEAPRPDLVLLDLNLPGKDGRDVLQEVRQAPALAMIPIVVLTTSMSQADVDMAYRLGANCYLTKPVGLEEYFALVRLTEKFWLRTARLPDEYHARGMSFS
jgi:two-component system, chemotaxis family, response regulator Rcp1